MPGAQLNDAHGKIRHAVWKKILAAKFQRENEQNTGNSYIVDEGIGEYISWKDK